MVLPATGIRSRSAPSGVADDLTQPLWHPSPNFGPRRDGAVPNMVVLHYTAMPSTRAALDWLCNDSAEVSAHYLIGRKGQVWQMVREEDRAWHAGAGAWGAVSDVNSHSIGIEISNDGVEPFSGLQMTAVETLLAAILRRWAIDPARVVAHSDTALGRKIDPGPRFDWRRLAMRGLSIWPQSVAQAIPDERFYLDARRFGYVWAEGQEEQVLNAFRLRFRPWGHGPICAEDQQAMAALAHRHPVDAAVVMV